MVVNLSLLGSLSLCCVWFWTILSGKKKNKMKEKNKKMEEKIKMNFNINKLLPLMLASSGKRVRRWG